MNFHILAKKNFGPGVAFSKFTTVRARMHLHRQGESESSKRSRRGARSDRARVKKLYIALDVAMNAYVTQVRGKTDNEHIYGGGSMPAEYCNNKTRAHQGPKIAQIGLD